MSDNESSRVEAFLADVSKRPQQRGNLIFALDATASRERTWDTAGQASGLDVPRSGCRSADLMCS